MIKVRIFKQENYLLVDGGEALDFFTSKICELPETTDFGFQYEADAIMIVFQGEKHENVLISASIDVYNNGKLLPEFTLNGLTERGIVNQVNKTL